MGETQIGLTAASYMLGGGRNAMTGVRTDGWGITASNKGHLFA